MPKNQKRRKRRKRGLVSGRKKQAGPHHKAKALTVAAAGHTSGQVSVLRFLLIFFILLALFYIFIAFSSFYSKRFLPSYHHLIAKTSGYMLAILGQDTTVTHTSIRSPRFSVSIVRGCDAVEAIALYIFAVLSFPLPFLKKLIGVTIGAMILSVLNLVRIVSLFLIGVYFRRIFHLTHIDVWQALFIFFAVLLWILWLLWATRSQVATRPASS